MADKSKWYESLIQGVTTVVKVSGGLAGKISLVLMVFAVCIGWAIHEVPNVWFAAGGIILMSAVVWRILSRLITFAETNPHAALLDGAHLVSIHRLDQKAKGGPTIIDARAIPNPALPTPSPSAIADGEADEPENTGPTLTKRISTSPEREGGDDA